MKNKLKLLTLGSLMVAFLASCAKTLNFADARKWVEEHYKVISGATVAKYHFKWDFSVSDQKIESYVVSFVKNILTHYSLDASRISKLNGEIKDAMPSSATSYFINVEIFDLLFYEEYKNDYKFEIKGDALTATNKYKSGESLFSDASGVEITSYDKTGYEIYEKVDISKVTIMDGATARGYIEINTELAGK